MKNYPLFFLLGGLLICAFLADIAIGSVNLSLSDVWATLTGNSDNLIYHEIILNHRLPKAITAILAGGALSVAGVLMQTLFHNPLAGPDVLGVTSGASLGVALLTLGTSTLPLWLITGWGQVMAPIIISGIFLALLLQKQLNVLLLGRNYASGLGISVTQLRLWIILATALLAGTSTAFTGPIAFIGITMPHIARGLFQTPNHRIILPASMLCGAIILLICDLISQMPGFQGTLPVNAVTALFGAPVIIWIILKNKG